MPEMPNPVAARSKVLVFGRSLAVIAGSNPTGRNECLSLVIVVCFQVEVSVAGLSLVQRSPTEYGVSKAKITLVYSTYYLTENPFVMWYFEYAKYHIQNLQHTICKRSWRWTSEVRNMSKHQVLWIELNHKTLCIFLDYIYMAVSVTLSQFTGGRVH